MSLVSEALDCLPATQTAVVAKLAEKQASKLSEQGEQAWSLIWRSVAAEADQSLLARLG